MLDVRLNVLGRNTHIINFKNGYASPQMSVLAKSMSEILLQSRGQINAHNAKKGPTGKRKMLIGSLIQFL